MHLDLFEHEALAFSFLLAASLGRALPGADIIQWPFFKSIIALVGTFSTVKLKYNSKYVQFPSDLVWSWLAAGFSSQLEIEAGLWP